MTNSPAPARRKSWLIWLPATWRQIGTDLAYILPGFLISLASFATLTALFTLGVSTLVMWVGLPVLVACLATARWFANVNRAALQRWAGGIPPVHYRTPHKYSITGMFKNMADPQLWKDFIHGFLIVLPLRTFTFCFSISWLATIAVGLTKWFWRVYLPEDGTELASILGLDTRLNMSASDAQTLLEVVIAVVFLLALPFITHALAVADAATTRALLSNETAALRARSEELATSRAQVVSEEASTLRKIERDLHDGPQQRLIRLQMDVAAAQRQMANNPEGARELMDGALEQSREALAELRSLSRGFAPPLLTDRGLRAAAESLAAKSTVPVTVSGSLSTGVRLAEAAENAAYFVISEALANVSKHAAASSAQVTVDALPDGLLIDITDDGVGGAHVGKGHGLAGLADRLAGVDGSLELVSPDGGPTTLRASIPLRD